MSDENSRYQNIPTASYTTTDASGQVQLHVYQRRRFLPSLAAQRILAEHVVIEGDRLDNLAMDYLGDPLQYWRLCDANRIFWPEQLIATPGRRFRISLR